MKRVLIATSTFGESSPPSLERLKEKGFSVTLNPYGRTLTEPEVLDLIRKVDPVAIIAGLEPITKQALSSAASLKVISRCGAGVNNIDLAEAKLKNIKVFNTPDVMTEAVAELTVSLMLNVTRRVCEADRLIRQGKWEKLMGVSISGMTVGIVGCGKIGNKVAEYLRVFGCSLLGYDIIAKDNKCCARVSLEELKRKSDLITFHIPSSKDNFHLINDNFIASMKDGSFIINTSRGDIIDEGALIRGLESKKISAAAIDTFESEPYSGRLINFQNVVLTSHMGSYSRQARIKMESESIDNLLKGMEV